MPDDPLFDYEAALAACARGERQGLQDLYLQESRRLLGVALRIVRERALAEDVLHDAFVKIWSRAASFDGARGTGRGWIYSVVRYTALNQVRDGAREVTVDEDAAEALDADHSFAAHQAAPDGFELRSDLGRLERCLAALPEVRRTCILYAYVDGCSHGEIATRLQAPLGTVKAWIQRSMGALKECMA